MFRIDVALYSLRARVFYRPFMKILSNLVSGRQKIYLSWSGNLTLFSFRSPPLALPRTFHPGIRTELSLTFAVIGLLR